MINKKPKIRDYRPGTFDKHVAYGQRDRKLVLVARGILKGFRVVCHSEKAARNLAYALRIRAERIEKSDVARFGLKVRVVDRKVFVLGTLKRGPQYGGRSGRHKPQLTAYY